MKKLSVISLLAGAWLFTGSLAWAATSENSITMTWNNPGSSNLSASTMQSSSWANANASAGLWVSQAGVPGTTSTAADSWGGNSAHGQTTASSLYAYTLVDGTGSADARASRGQWFQVLNGSSASFNLTYFIFQDVNAEGDEASGNVNAWGRIWDGLSWSDYIYGEAGSLRLDYSANTVDWLYLEAGVGSYSEVNAVPAPGAIWLLGSGLFSLLGLRKK